MRGSLRTSHKRLVLGKSALSQPVDTNLYRPTAYDCVKTVLSRVRKQKLITKVLSLPFDIKHGNLFPKIKENIW